MLRRDLEPRMVWRRESDGCDAPGHERYVSVHPAHGSPDDRYVVSLSVTADPPTSMTDDAPGYVALFEGMHACTESEACFDFRQDVCPGAFSTLEQAQEACAWHARQGHWPDVRHPYSSWKTSSTG